MSNINVLNNPTEASKALMAINLRLETYGVNRPQESKTLPGALVTEPDQLRALAYSVNIVEMLATGNFKFIAIAPWGWAHSTTPEEALKRVKKEKPRTFKSKNPIKLYLAIRDTDIHGDGSWSYPQGYEPILLEGRTSRDA